STPDEKLMKGIIKANPSPDTGPFDPTNTSYKMTFTITNLPSGTYDVYVYCMENGTGAKMDLTNTTTWYNIAQEADFSINHDTYIAALPGGPGQDYVEANYGKFAGVAAAADGTITVSAVKHIDTPQVNDGIGVAGIQVVQVSGGAFGANTV